MADSCASWIPSSAPRDPGNELFDPHYMSTLYDYGYERATNNVVWTEIDLKNVNVPQER